MQKQAYWPFLIAIAIPVLLILFVIGTIYRPQTSIKPKYGFIYTNTTSYAYDSRYTVKDSHLTFETPPPIPSLTTYPDYSPIQKPPLYLYDVTTSHVTKVTEDQVKNWQLSDQPTSPDGYVVIRDTSYDELGFIPALLFGGYHHDGIVIKNEHDSKNLNLPIDNSYGFTFIAWVLKN